MTKKLEQLRARRAKLDQQIKEEEKREKAQARKKRNHNLIEYGAVAEKSLNIDKNTDPEIIKNLIASKIKFANHFEKYSGIKIISSNLPILEETVKYLEESYLSKPETSILQEAILYAKKELREKSEAAEEKKKEESRPPVTENGSNPADECES